VTNSPTSTSEFAYLYLGTPGVDPRPVFRDLSPSGVQEPDGRLTEWPSDAVFAVTFRPDDNRPLPESTRRELPRTDFFSADGWPIDLPSEHCSLSSLVKREFQTFPQSWREWGDGDWKRANLRPEMVGRVRALGSVLRPVLQSLHHQRQGLSPHDFPPEDSVIADSKGAFF
jgi:hypothetical protein